MIVFHQHFFHQVLTAINEHNTSCAEPGTIHVSVNHTGKLACSFCNNVAGQYYYSNFQQMWVTYTAVYLKEHKQHRENDLGFHVFS